MTESVKEQERGRADSVIRVSRLSKRHRLYARPIDRLLQPFYGSRKQLYTEFWALKGIDLDIKAGETVGIVGRNGAGKSTLLQIIAGTMRQTEGDVFVRGRVAALLELGSGFNPEFTGKENVFLNAQVLGLTRSEVEERYEVIVEFAGLGDFINRPVRTYSSGMLVRLAFAVAINIEPDLLIIDEALAVGDESFQRKCYSRIEEIKARGATILFVSHAAQSVVQLCDRAVLIEAGERILTAPPREVIACYHRLLHAEAGNRGEILHAIKKIDERFSGLDSHEISSAEAFAKTSADSEVRHVPRVVPIRSSHRYDPGLQPESTMEYTPNGARITDPHFLATDGERVNVLVPGGEYIYQYTVDFTRTVQMVEFGMTIKTISGLELFGMSSQGRGGFIPEIKAGTRVRVEFRFMSRFQPATYFVNAGCQAIVDGERKNLHRILDAACFRIELPSSDRYMIGFYDLSSEPSAIWTILE